MEMTEGANLPENTDGYGGLAQRTTVLHLPQRLRAYSGRVARLTLVLHRCNWKTNVREWGMHLALTLTRPLPLTTRA